MYLFCFNILVLLCSQLPPSTSESCEFDDPRLLQNIENDHVSLLLEYRVFKSPILGLCGIEQ